MPCDVRAGLSEIIYSHMVTHENCSGYMVRDIICIMLLILGSLSLYFHPDRKETPVRHQIFLYVCFVLWIPFFEFLTAFAVICLLIYAEFAPAYVAMQEEKRRLAQERNVRDQKAVNNTAINVMSEKSGVDSVRITVDDVESVRERLAKNVP